MPEGRLYQSMLLDFYGELLAPRQRECFDLHFNEDLSLSEIAEACGISRQGAWDNIRRASESLGQIEEKTGLIRRFSETQAELQILRDRLEHLEELAAREGKANPELKQLAHEAAEQVRTLLKRED